MAELDFIDVESSNVARIAYDDENQILHVQFLNGSHYKYMDVPETVYNGMLIAASKGRYLWRNIRDQYEYLRIS